MDIYKYLRDSLKKAIDLSGNMRKLADSRDMDYSTINRYNSGENAIENMPIKTLVKIFPELSIYCFIKDIPPILSTPTVRDSDIMDELAKMVIRLSPREKLHLLTIVAANFGDKYKKEG